MSISRRALLAQFGAVAASGIVCPATASFADARTIRAIAFDAFPIFDPRPIFAACERLFPDRGAELANLWRTRQFEYQWLRALGGHYEKFWKATEDALVFAADSLKLDFQPEHRDTLMHGYLELKAWPDVRAALARLRSKGLRLAFLSNATQDILHAGIRNSKLDPFFEHVISTDSIQTFKPDPRAYQLGADTLRLHKEEILFVAFAGWDVAGAKWFGYPTFWNNRRAAAAEQLSVMPDASGSSLAQLVDYLEEHSAYERTTVRL